ncbi:MAG: RDD family protein [Acidobacteria bacterium]|nr:RDD family protein [Acidobacteriota bacterium]MBI3469842.1 RDD family protein [Candidatus Solibacter usitatus]
MDRRPACPAPEHYPVADTVGALATAMGVSVRPEPAEVEVTEAAAPSTVQRAPRQQSFAWEGESDKVIPFPRTPTAAPPAHRPRPRRPVPDPESQPYLEFLPPAPHAPRTLATSVEASIFCDAAVATHIHRAVAFALDAGIVLIAFALFVATVAIGAELRFDPATLPYYGLALYFTALFYGASWILAGSDSAGRRWTGLRTINFDGFPVTRRERWVRFAAGIVSFGPLGLGLAWALVDEESLTWHDHISKTFPTLKE